MLWGGSAIRSAIEAKGASNVYVVLVSRGPGATPYTRTLEYAALSDARTGLDFERSATAAGKTVTHVAHSYAHDNNAQHRGNGAVIKKLYDEGLIRDALFWIKPEYRFLVPRGDLVRFQALTPADSAAVRGAIKACETQDSAAGLEAVGYRSTPWYFKLLELDDELTSVLHTADVAG